MAESATTINENGDCTGLGGEWLGPKLGRPGPEHQRAQTSTRPLNRPAQRTEPSERLVCWRVDCRCAGAMMGNCYYRHCWCNRDLATVDHPRGTAELGNLPVPHRRRKTYLQSF